MREKIETDLNDIQLRVRPVHTVILQMELERYDVFGSCDGKLDGTVRAKVHSNNFLFPRIE